MPVFLKSSVIVINKRLCYFAANERVLLTHLVIMDVQHTGNRITIKTKDGKRRGNKIETITI